MAAYPQRKAPARAQPETLARGLGWLSVGLAGAQLFAPGVISRVAGVPLPRFFVTLCGLRELACGLGLLTQEQAAPWLKARIAGDVLDLVALAASAMLPITNTRRIAVATAAVSAVTALDIYCRRELAVRGRRFPPRHETLSADVERTPQELYRFWRDFTNLPRVMPHLTSVEVLDATRSHWVAAGPAGTRIEWDSEIIDDRPNERIAWRSLEGSSVFNAGSVQFRSAAEHGTRVHLELLYDQPAGTLRDGVRMLFGKDPASSARADLAMFKHLMEAGQSKQNGGRST